jgi:hypothetical protein
LSKLGLGALAGLLLISCSQSNPVVGVPQDGIHITGAATGLYPIADGGTCAVPQLPTGQRQLIFSPNPGPGDASFGAVVTNFEGVGAYADVSLYVAVSGQTWSTKSGAITVRSADATQAAGTIDVKGVKRVDGMNTVDVSGSWTCRMLAVPSGGVTPEGTPSPAPSTSATPAGTPVEKQVLPPATDFPVANLCSTPLQYTANGNATPLFCRGGELNVLAWKFYASVSPSILGLGLNPTAGQVQAALCDDFNHSHATKVEEQNGFALATAYYGWTFNITPDPATCR